MPLDVASLRIVHYPAPILREKAKPIATITPEVRAAVDRMFELMREDAGIGLAATQVGLAWRLFIVDVPAPEKPPTEGEPIVWSEGPRVYINPVLSTFTGAPEPYEEGCLSLPEIRGDVLRPPVVSLSALDLDGREIRQTAGGLLARCWQHEVDHLDGVLIIDRFTQLSRMKNRVAIRDLERA